MDHGGTLTATPDGASHAPLPATLNGLFGDRYRIERELGVGGMSTVYLAYDVRHDRPVAIKILHPELASAVGPERFLAEIRTTASLQHPHILGLLDSGDLDGMVYYVMPYVDGESLRQRLIRDRQLPIADAVRIATELAGALDYAHRRGVIHRDIKPENILLHEGSPLLVDFGIALAISRPREGARLTATGISLGTPEYMSPEQAMGEGVLDARTDIYALGVVLYEMLVGEPPFTGATAQAVIARVMTAEPAPIETVRKSVPSNVDAATMTALHKVAADRFASAAAFATALEDPHYEAVNTSEQRALRNRGRDVLAGRAALVVVILLLLASLAIVARRSLVADSRGLVARFEVVVPDSAASAFVTLSHDGTRLLWASDAGFFERALDSLGIRRLRNATPPTNELHDDSPTGAEALLTGRGAIAVAALLGGAPHELVANGARAPIWGTDGYVYFAFAGPSGGSARLVGRMRSSGGGVDTLATVDGGLLAMVALPRGRGLVLSVGRGDTARLVALDLRTRALHSLGLNGTSPQFVEPRWLLYVDGASVMAVPLDVDKLATAATARALESPTTAVRVIAARGDALVYATAPEQVGPGARLLSRGGVWQPLANVPDTLRLSGFALSRDGSRLAMSGTSMQAPLSSAGGRSLSNLYVYELAAQRLTRLRSEERDQRPAWTSDGRALSFVRVSVDSPTTSTLMLRAWDGSGVPTPVLSRPGGARESVLGPVAWLPDGRHAIVRVARESADGRAPPSGDLVLLSLDAPQRLDTIVATEYSESEPSVTSDGRLLAFTSDESGHTEVYVRAVQGGEVHRVSLSGGTLPHWGQIGSTLFFANADTLFTAPIREGADLRVGAVQRVLVSRRLSQGYAVLPGDSRFVVAAAPATSRLVVVTGITADLARLFPRP